MTEQTWWLVGALATLIAAAIGFFVGRSFGGAKSVDELEAEVARQDEISGYKREVESHFDKTASLVASMAGSYKDLFEHLSSGYEKALERLHAGSLQGAGNRAAARQRRRRGVAASLPDGEEESAQGATHESKRSPLRTGQRRNRDDSRHRIEALTMPRNPTNRSPASDEALEQPHSGAGEAQAATPRPAPAQSERQSDGTREPSRKKPRHGKRPLANSIRRRTPRRSPGRGNSSAEHGTSALRGPGTAGGAGPEVRGWPRAAGQAVDTHPGAGGRKCPGQASIARVRLILP